MDEEARNLPFAPPEIPVEVQCLHCGNIYLSSEMRFVPRQGKPWHAGDLGDWVCAAPGCDACGFGFDIFPTDPDYQDEHGGWCMEDGEEAVDEDDFSEETVDSFVFDPTIDDEDESFEEFDDAFSPANMDWLDIHDFPHHRRWNIVFHFHTWTPGSREESNHGMGFGDEDIPF